MTDRRSSRAPSRERVLEIESVASGGDGVGREPSGRVVFVPRTAPGDRARVELIRERPTWARGHLVRLERASDRRIRPACPLYGSCGGCQLQHLEREAELEAKAGMVREALRRIGGREVEVPTPVTEGPELGYRNRLTFTLRRRDGEGVTAGYHRWDRPGRILDVPDCPLGEPPLREAWRALRASWGPEAGRLPAGRELRITLRASASGGVAMTVRETDTGPGRGRRRGRTGTADSCRTGVSPEVEAAVVSEPERDASLEAAEAADGTEAVGDPRSLAGTIPGLESYLWRPRDGDWRTLAGSPWLEERWEGLAVRLGPDVFLQVNRAVAAALEARLDGWLDRRAGGPAGLRLLDLHAGLGTRAIRWTRAGASTVACELEPAAVASGREAARRAGVAVEMEEGSVEERLPELLPADVAVVNPPRSGLEAGTTLTLRDAPLGALVYVSCDPATLARDLERLGPSWGVEGLVPFDAFPGTAHVETLVWLERR